MEAIRADLSSGNLDEALEYGARYLQRFEPTLAQKAGNNDP
jgi:hypothetical protein